RTVADSDQAVDVANLIGWPVALKAAGVARPAKTEAGGVAVDVHDAAELRRAYERMQRLLGAFMTTGVVQAMAPAGVDVRIGMVRSELVGAVLTLEVDRAFVPEAPVAVFQVVPCSDRDAAATLDRAGLAAAFTSPQVASVHLDAEAIDRATASVGELLQRVSVIAETIPEVTAIVLDPVIVSSDGAIVTDVRVRMQDPNPGTQLPIRRLPGR
ncbi:MAG: acetate--CoA ligase family protein, partial [Actinobacteria bacterium]|nr:acetate--CoA ligase family protein [Actinomycetota bacterium]